MSELCELTQWDYNKLQVLSYFKMPTIQRLGYVLDLLEQSEQTDALYSLMKQTDRKTLKIPLKAGQAEVKR